MHLSEVSSRKDNTSKIADAFESIEAGYTSSEVSLPPLETVTYHLKTKIIIPFLATSSSTQQFASEPKRLEEPINPKVGNFQIAHISNSSCRPPNPSDHCLDIHRSSWATNVTIAQRFQASARVLSRVWGLISVYASFFVALRKC